MGDLEDDLSIRAHLTMRAGRLGGTRRARTAVSAKAFFRFVGWSSHQAANASRSPLYIQSSLRRWLLEKSNLIPFVRENLDILFVGLNPAKGSSDKRHYFSVNQAFWNQLYSSGLIISPVDKSNADEISFGGTNNNFHSWSFGITDLVPEIAESNSSQIKPSSKDCETLSVLVQRLSPKVAILLHRKVVEYFVPFVGYPLPPTNSGQVGAIIANCPTMFFDIAFPHGNAISTQDKITQYQKVKHYLESFEASNFKK
jgi:hypothetical protein